MEMIREICYYYKGSVSYEYAKGLPYNELLDLIATFNRINSKPEDI